MMNGCACIRQTYRQTDFFFCLTETTLRYLKLLSVLFVLVISLMAFSIYHLFVSPHDDSIEGIDIVMVLAGGTGDRLDKAQMISETVRSRGKAVDVIVSIGDGQYHGREAIEDYCTPDQGGWTQPGKPPICFELKPEFDSTRGEVSEMSRLATERGYRSLAVVSSDYHILRASLWFKRCFKADVRALSSVTIHPRKLKYLTRKITREILAIGDFLIFNRQCWTQTDLVRYYRP